MNRIKPERILKQRVAFQSSIHCRCVPLWWDASEDSGTVSGLSDDGGFAGCSHGQSKYTSTQSLRL